MAFRDEKIAVFIEDLDLQNPSAMVTFTLIFKHLPEAPGVSLAKLAVTIVWHARI